MVVNNFIVFFYELVFGGPDSAGWAARRHAGPERAHRMACGASVGYTWLGLSLGVDSRSGPRVQGVSNSAGRRAGTTA